MIIALLAVRLALDGLDHPLLDEQVCRTARIGHRHLGSHDLTAIPAHQLELGATASLDAQDERAARRHE
jgi:hypothetical protein